MLVLMVAMTLAAAAEEDMPKVGMSVDPAKDVMDLVGNVFNPYKSGPCYS